MNTSSCRHDMQELVLHFYGELGDAESEEINVRLQACPDCKEYYAGLLAMESVVPRTPSVEPDETVMAAIRSVTARRIRERQAQVARKSARPLIPRIRPGWVRWSLVATACAVVFVAGRLSIAPESQRAPSADSPSIAEISDLAFNSETGRVDVEYRTVEAGMVSGSLGDSHIQSLVEYALTSADNPATRLRAVKMLNSIAPDVFQPDAELVSALIQVIRDDPNDGMKLQALKALRRVHQDLTLNTELRDLLMSVLDSSPNSALRIEALGLLTESEVTRLDLSRILARAAMDENSFVRFRAQEEMDLLEENVALEQLN